MLTNPLSVANANSQTSESFYQLQLLLWSQLYSYFISSPQNEERDVLPQLAVQTQSIPVSPRLPPRLPLYLPDPPSHQPIVFLIPHAKHISQ